MRKSKPRVLKSLVPVFWNKYRLPFFKDIFKFLVKIFEASHCDPEPPRRGVCCTSPTLPRAPHLLSSQALGPPAALTPPRGPPTPGCSQDGVHTWSPQSCRRRLRPQPRSEGHTPLGHVCRLSVTRSEALGISSPSPGPGAAPLSLPLFWNMQG